MCIELYRTVSKTYAPQIVSRGTPVAQIFDLPELSILARCNARATRPIADRRNGRLKPCAISALLFCFFTQLAHAQTPTPAETASFNSAANALKFGMLEKARIEFAEFARKFPQSADVPKALLLEAQAALKMGDTKAAEALLTGNLPKAGAIRDQYQYSLGEVHLQASNYVAAAKDFESVARDFPESRGLDATYNQAFALFNLKDWPTVINLLQNPEGPFQKQARVRPEDEVVAGGLLLLAQALMNNGQLQEAQERLNELLITSLTPELKWQREFLLCRIHMAAGRLEAALAGSTNLVALANSVASPERRADSISLQAAILQQLNNFSSAAAAYEQNLSKDVPAGRRRESFLKLVDLTLAQETIDEAARKLERLLSEHAAEPGSEVARFTLGELRLKQHFTQSTTATVGTNAVLPSTNLLQSALFQFDEVLKAPPPLFAGRAQLNRGWCLWELGRINESAAAFKAAVDQLPRSQDQAVGRFKLGEALLAGKDYPNARASFGVGLTNYEDLPAVSKSIVPQAWYNVLRCSIALNDLPQASAAMIKILRFYPTSPFADKSMLLVGQELSSRKKPADARKVFADFKQRFPESSLLPEVELAIARSYQQE